MAEHLSNVVCWGWHKEGGAGPHAKGNCIKGAYELFTSIGREADQEFLLFRVELKGMSESSHIGWCDNDAGCTPYCAAAKCTVDRSGAAGSERCMVDTQASTVEQNRCKGNHTKIYSLDYTRLLELCPTSTPALLTACPAALKKEVEKVVHISPQISAAGQEFSPDGSEAARTDFRFSAVHPNGELGTFPSQNHTILVSKKYMGLVVGSCSSDADCDFCDAVCEASSKQCRRKRGAKNCEIKTYYPGVTMDLFKSDCLPAIASGHPKQAPTDSKFFFTITVSMPYSKAEFDADKKSKYKIAVATAAGTIETNVDLVEIKEKRRRAGSIDVVTKVSN